MTSKNAPEDFKFKESEEYKWLKENAHKYGFIERYPEGKEKLSVYGTKRKTKRFTLHGRSFITNGFNKYWESLKPDKPYYLQIFHQQL